MHIHAEKHSLLNRVPLAKLKSAQLHASTDLTCSEPDHRRSYGHFGLYTQWDWSDTGAGISGPVRYVALLPQTRTVLPMLGRDKYIEHCKRREQLRTQYIQ